jgi:hypothetical protein
MPLPSANAPSVDSSSVAASYDQTFTPSGFNIDVPSQSLEPMSGPGGLSGSPGDMQAPTDGVPVSGQPLPGGTDGISWPDDTFTAGLSLQISSVIPGMSGGGGIAGFNVQVFAGPSDFGFGIYEYNTPSSDNSIGVSAGASLTGNVAWGNGQYTGLFTQLEANVSDISAGYFTTTGMQSFSDPGFVGGNAGFSIGSPLGEALTVSNYTPLIEFGAVETIQQLFATPWGTPSF